MNDIAVYYMHSQREVLSKTYSEYAVTSISAFTFFGGVCTTYQTYCAIERYGVRVQWQCAVFLLESIIYYATLRTFHLSQY